MVEADIKNFKLPVNVQSMIPQNQKSSSSNMTEARQIVPRCNSTSFAASNKNYHTSQGRPVRMPSGIKTLRHPKQQVMLNHDENQNYNSTQVLPLDKMDSHQSLEQKAFSNYNTKPKTTRDVFDLKFNPNLTQAYLTEK